MTCAFDPVELALLAVGGLEGRRRRRAEAHVGACATCRDRYAQLVGVSLAMHEAEIARPPESLKALQVETALRPVPPDSRPVWPWALALATAVLVAIAGWVWRQTAGLPAMPRIEAGAVATRSGELLPGEPLGEVEALSSCGAVGRTVLRLADRSTVVAAAGSEFSLTRLTPPSWSVGAGALDFALEPQRPDSPFSVTTPEATVTAVGTEFRVERDPGRASTTIAVYTGLVRVQSHVDGGVLPLAAGGQLVVDGASPASSHRLEAGDQADDAFRQDVKSVRNTLGAGQVGAARAWLEHARAEQKSREAGAELAILAAEMALAEHHHAEAIRLYLAVVRDYDGTTQAEASLFAAAQLAAEHPEAGVSGTELLERYLRSYPKGQFREVVEVLLRAHDTKATP